MNNFKIEEKNMNKILIIEDDIKLKKYMKEYLIGYDFQVESIEDFNKIKDKILESKADLILLDINLPMFDGFYFLNFIRKNLKTPVIIVSARSEEGEQIRGMDMGADDYITKPFSMGVVLAKINAVLRRYTASEDKFISVKNMILYYENMKLKVDDEFIEVSKNEFKLLKLFMNNYNKIITRQELLEELWDDEIFVDDNTLTVNVTRLKKKLRDLDAGAVIETKRGVGYVLQ